MTATIHVCVSCQDRGPVLASQGEGGSQVLIDALRQQLGKAMPASAFVITPQSCFGPCGRGVRLAVAGPGRWGWLFEALRPGDDLDAFSQFLTAWLASPDGVVAKSDCPARLFRKTVGRVPPSDGGQASRTLGTEQQL